MAHFPYSVQEEPLFVIYHIDNILSVTGANMLHSFKEVSYFHAWSNSFSFGIKKNSIEKSEFGPNQRQELTDGFLEGHHVR